ncbi:MAG: glycosyltransferase family 2 protein [Bdellovibrionota bacterium]
MDITVLLPIYNERENLVPLLTELQGVLREMGRSYEIIAVDDGSSDGGPALLEKLAQEYPMLRVILFRRNAGQTAAFEAGFRHASGNVIVTMDSDGQNDPRDIPQMIGLLDKGYDFVAGRRKNRKDGFFLRKFPSMIANRIIRWVTKTTLHDLGCSLKVYRREITDELRLYGEMHRFIGVLVEGLGARVIEFDVNHRPRSRGVSKYGLSRTFKVVLDLITVWFMRGFQTKPIYVFGGTGIVLMLAGLAASAFVLYEKFALGIWVHKNPLFILSVIFAVIGVQFFGLGLIAEMNIRTYFESQTKPTYLIKTKLNFSQKQTA